MKKLVIMLAAVIGFGFAANAQSNELASLSNSIANNVNIVEINTSSNSDCWSIWSTTEDEDCVVGSEIRYSNSCGESIKGALVYYAYDGVEWSNKRCVSRTLWNNYGNATLLGNSFSREGKCFDHFFENKTCDDKVVKDYINQ
jgi:hypothetical protein